MNVLTETDALDMLDAGADISPTVQTVTKMRTDDNLIAQDVALCIRYSAAHLFKRM